MRTITNGFEQQQLEPDRDFPPGKCLFRHIGMVASHRDPDVLLQGLQRACATPGAADDIVVQFIGPVGDYDLAGAIERLGLTKNALCLGTVSQRESKQYMRGTDVLILLQTITGPGKDVVAGKAYEYLSTGCPILAVVPPDGGDAWLTNATKSGLITGVEDPQRVADGLLHYWRLWKAGKLRHAVVTEDIGHFERRSLTGDLATLFDEVLSERSHL